MLHGVGVGPESRFDACALELYSVNDLRRKQSSSSWSWRSVESCSFLGYYGKRYYCELVNELVEREAVARGR